MSKRITIFGGCGYLGHILVPYLLNNGYKITVIDNLLYGNFLQSHPRLNIVASDIRYLLKYDYIYDQILSESDAVVILAAMSLELAKDLNPEVTIAINSAATKKLIECAKRNKVKRCIFASSGSVYGNQSRTNITEECETQPTTLYGELKLEVENFLINQSDDNFITTATRSSTIVGWSPRFRIDLVMNRFIADSFFTKEICIHGTGEQSRTAIHILDAVDFIKTLLEVNDNIINKQIFNVVNEYFTINELAERVAKLTKCSIVREEILTDDRSYQFIGDKAKQILNWEPKYSLEDAMNEVYLACKKNLITGKERTNLEILKAKKYDEWTNF